MSTYVHHQITEGTRKSFSDLAGDGLTTCLSEALGKLFVKMVMLGEHVPGPQPRFHQTWLAVKSPMEWRLYYRKFTGKWSISIAIFDLGGSLAKKQLKKNPFDFRICLISVCHDVQVSVHLWRLHLHFC